MAGYTKRTITEYGDVRILLYSQVIKMIEDKIEKVLIVEGKSDKRKVKSIVKEPVEIFCTNGTISMTKLDEWIDLFFEKDVYILVDSDEAGEKLRKLLKREFPHAEHIYIDKMYREVATAPVHHLATVLLGANIDVHAQYLKKEDYF
ncbi:DNA primase,Toprim domain protein [Bacillus methanolicus MGA3]|uniref:Toprim domain protein n=2 Tax=Bacillus methanolicus TaxID=1471 RepID=I3DUG0_BACMM|nr:Toprim domain protein [Bacillus methanolicus MGA3]EIJ77881.1 DNA primase,Toprim domain protein [Bacillus methanolicus MGA3]